MAEKQVLFRIDARMLDSLDRKLARDGYATRNAWFKEVVSGYSGGRGGAKKAGGKKPAAKKSAKRKAPAKKARRAKR